jgi:hypothetical protein
MSYLMSPVLTDIHYCSRRFPYDNIIGVVIHNECHMQVEGNYALFVASGTIFCRSLCFQQQSQVIVELFHLVSM